MEQSFGERLSTLRKAHYFLRQEMESLARYAPIEAEALRRLRDMARSFQEQAHSLLVTMAYEEASETLQEEAEETQSEPAADAAPKTRRKKSEAVEGEGSSPRSAGYFGEGAGLLGGG